MSKSKRYGSNGLAMAHRLQNFASEACQISIYELNASQINRVKLRQVHNVSIISIRLYK